jgi:hypothetical protein
VSLLGERLLRLWSDPLSIGVVEHGAVAMSVALAVLDRPAPPVVGYRSGNLVQQTRLLRYRLGKCLSCGQKHGHQFHATERRFRPWCSPCETKRRLERHGLAVGRSPTRRSA